MTIRLALKEMLQGVPQGGMKGSHVKETPTWPSQPIQRKAGAKSSAPLHGKNTQ